MFDSDWNIGNKQRIYEVNHIVALPVLAVLPSGIVGMHIMKAMDAE